MKLETNTKILEENIKLKLEILTLIIGYESELKEHDRKQISDFSKGCMERYFQLMEEIKGQ